jgi:HEAT repeat protein
MSASDPSEAMHAERALSAYLKDHPEAAARVAREIAARSRDDRYGQALLRALVRDGGPESQRAMVDLVKQWKTDARAIDVLPLLSLPYRPTRETEDFLVALRADTSAASLAPSVDSALGAIAGQLQDSDPARADAIAARFEDQVRSAKDPFHLEQALVAMGNTRSERILDMASQFLTSEDLDVRRAAVFALGRAPDAPDTRAALEKIAANDADQTVRRTAQRALARRGG